MRKSSKQRDKMLDFIMSSDRHWSPNEIFTELEKTGEKVSLATIYRNLGILVELGQIRRITLPSEGVVYDRRVDPHYHFYCVKCDKLFDLPLTYKTEWNSSLEHDTGMTVLDHELTVRGICAACAKKSSN